MADSDALLQAAEDADYWDFAVRLGEGIDPDERAPKISARLFNTIVHFIAPTDNKPAWQLAEQRVDSELPDRIRAVSEVSTAQVIEVVPEWARTLGAQHHTRSRRLAAVR